MKSADIDKIRAAEIYRAELAGRRRARDRAADELYEKLVELRLTFHLLFGAGTSDELFGIADDVPIEPPILRQVAEQVYDALVDRELILPAQRLGDLVVDPRRLAAGLEGPMRDLEAALAALERALRDAATGAGETTAAKRSIDSTFPKQTQRRPQ